MEPDLINPYELRHIHRTERRFGDIPSQIILVMLHNLKKTEDQLSDNVERWCYLFKDPSLSSGIKKIEEIKIIHDPEKLAAGNPHIAQLIDRITMDKLPPEVRETYLSRLRYHNGAVLDIEYKARAEGRLAGRAEGRAEGKAEGEKQAKLAIAHTLLADGLAIDRVMQITGLTQEEMTPTQT